MRTVTLGCALIQIPQYSQRILHLSIQLFTDCHLTSLSPPRIESSCGSSKWPPRPPPNHGAPALGALSTSVLALSFSSTVDSFPGDCLGTATPTATPCGLQPLAAYQGRCSDAPHQRLVSISHTKVWSIPSNSYTRHRFALLISRPRCRLCNLTAASFI